MTPPTPGEPAADELATLPEIYATALRLARCGTAPGRIAVNLGIPVESVASLLVLAEAKLTAASRRRSATTTHEPDGAHDDAEPFTAAPDNSSET